MALWQISPHDPLTVRDGRPFGVDPGVCASSLAFPYPSALAGAIRTQVGKQGGGFRGNGEDHALIAKLQQISVRGPLLWQEVPGKPLAEKLLLPRPHDALLLPPAADAAPGTADRQWLAPVTMRATTDWSGGLHLVGPHSPRMVKPLPPRPAYWYWPAYRNWLLNPDDDRVLLNTLGIDGPTQVVRTHVRIAPETQTAAEAMLFQTDGYEYVGTGWSPDAAYEKPNGRSPLANRAPLSLLVDTDAELRGGVDTLGGEARLVSWHQIAGALPRCPGELVKAVQAAQACRLVLASPATFAGGYLPDFTWLRAQFPNLKIEVAAALVTRYDVISGWDFAIQKPKATRRLVPAGSVYYLTLKDSTPADIDAFVRAVWFQNISDDEQTRRDGFGLAIVGTWDGKPRPMEVRPTHQEDRYA